MAEKTGSVPPANLNGISRPGRGGVVVKPKNMKGTLRRLWKLTRGHRKGVGWILLLSAVASVSAILSPYVTGRAVAAVSGGVGVEGVLFVEGRISDLGLVTSFLLYVRQFTRPFVEIANIYNNFQTAVAGAERVFEILDEEPEPPDREGALELGRPRGDIELRQVEFGYTPGEPVLKGVSVKIPAGTQAAIVGATGSGKTTIINLLTRFYDVWEGSILLDGRDLRDYRMEDLREAFGVVLQDTALFAVSVRENICYGHPEASLEQIREAARTAGADRMGALPNREPMKS